jgi:hypothetical protein
MLQRGQGEGGRGVQSILAPVIHEFLVRPQPPAAGLKRQVSPAKQKASGSLAIVNTGDRQWVNSCKTSRHDHGI